MNQLINHQDHKQYHRCKKCFKLILQNVGILQPICGAHYCPRCLCSIYQSDYIENQNKSIVELYCSHFINRQVIQKAIKDYCINCGAKFNPRVDVQMKDRIKLCRECFDHESAKYNQTLNQCMSCNRIIRLIDFLAETEIMLCKDCATQQSEIQATTFSQNPTTYKQVEPRTHPQESSKNSSRRGKIGHSYTQKNIVSKENRASLRREEDDLPEDISIVSRFSALQIQYKNSGQELQESEEKGMKKIKVTTKHSMDIRVQNLKINIYTRSNNNKICQICTCFIADGGMLTDNNKNQCKLCYMLTYNPRQSGFYRSFALVSNTDSRDKYTSAPKNKGFLGDGLNIQNKEMKKSMMSGGKSDMNYLASRTSQDLHLDMSQVKKQSIWDFHNKKDRLCQICKAKDYKITRVDKKKVCQDCYYRS